MLDCKEKILTPDKRFVNIMPVKSTQEALRKDLYSNPLKEIVSVQSNKSAKCEHNHKYDQLGMFGSAICGLHCAITPLIISLLLSMKAHSALFQGWESLNWVFFLLAPIFGFLGLKSAYKKHLSKIPFFAFSTGLVILSIGLFFPMSNHNLEHLLSSCGGFIMAGAHLINLKLSQS
jgi:hypothetical protein